MFHFLLHLHCILLHLLHVILFSCAVPIHFSQHFSNVSPCFFWLNPEQRDRPSLVQMIPKLDSTSTCLECQDMPWVTEMVHLVGQGGLLQLFGFPFTNKLSLWGNRNDRYVDLRSNDINELLKKWCLPKLPCSLRWIQHGAVLFFASERH